MVSAAELIAAGRQFKRAAETLFGQPVQLRSLSGAERDLLRSRAQGSNPLTAAELVALAVVGEDGAAVFTADQVAELASCDGGEIDRVAMAVLELSGLGRNAQDDAAKN